MENPSGKAAPNRKEPSQYWRVPLGFGAAGFVLAISRELFRGKGEEIPEVLSGYTDFDWYVSHQLNKGIKEEPVKDIKPEFPGSILEKVIRVISKADELLEGMNLSFDPSKISFATELMRGVSFYPFSSSESVAFIHNGYAYPRVGLTDRELEKFFSLPHEGVVSITGRGVSTALCSPYEGGFISKLPLDAKLPKSVFADGSLIVIAGIAGIDEKFAEGNPKPAHVGLHVFSSRGNLHIPISTAEEFGWSSALTSIGVTEETATYGVYIYSNDTVSVTVVEVDDTGHGWKHKQITTDFGSIRELFKDRQIAGSRIIRHLSNTNNTTFFWELVVNYGDHIGREIVEQSISNEGIQKFEIFRRKYNEKGGVDYTLLGRVGNTTAILQSSENQILGVIFVDTDGKKYYKSVTTDTSFEPEFVTIVKNPGEDSNRIFLGVNGRDNTEVALTIIKEVKVDKEDRLYREIFIR